MLLEARCLSKVYDSYYEKVHALDGVSFDVDEGEFVAVVGASGSGKSTLLHILGGVDRPTSGSVFFRGKDIYKLNPGELAEYRRDGVSVVYQFYNLLPMLNVYDNIVISQKLAGRQPDEGKLKKLLADTGLSDKEFYYPNQLSGGQKQRVAVARAVMTGAEVILADEPTGNLDSKNSDAVMELLRKYNREYGRAVIVVTHDDRIAGSADRIIEISDGRTTGDRRKK